MTYDLTNYKITAYRYRHGCSFSEAVAALIQDRLADIETKRQEKAYHVMMSLAWDTAKKTFGGTLADRFEWMADWLKRRFYIPFYQGKTKFSRIYDAIFCGTRWLPLCWYKHLKTKAVVTADTTIEYDITGLGVDHRDIDAETDDFLMTVPEPIRDFCRLKIEGYGYDEIRKILRVAPRRMTKMRRWTEAFLTGEYDDAEATADLSRGQVLAFEASKSGGYMSVADDVCPTLGTTTVPAILEV